MLAVIGSSTSANRLKRHLYNKGIRVEIMQTPRKVGQSSCSLSIVFDRKYKEAVTDAAKDLGIRIVEVRDDLP